MNRPSQFLSLSRRPVRPAIALFVLAATAGCQATVAPCEGGDCPVVPGCEDDPSAVCDKDHVCQERVCEGVGWICGLDLVTGAYVWSRKNAACDDGDACTDNDLCAGARCVGVKKACTTPPKPACTDGKTLLTYAGTGTCEGGTCAYAPKKTTCPGSCSAGKCTGSPCTGITCDAPPNQCYAKPGTCKNGTCSYTPRAAGTACAVSDACVTSATCDGKGTCSGSKKSCSAANTTGGTCVNGACQGYKCTSGWGNCNGTWSDGCEVRLNTSKNCGKCGKTCTAPAHASASCSSSGNCTFSYKAPYKDCDKLASNGCEVPVGVPNACSKSGITYNPGGKPSGCGTAHCGSSASSKAKNFGTWTCVFCVHCHKFSDGYSWCLSGDGLFSSARCQTCCNSSSADKVCNK